uniref:Putative trypsin-like serine protease n=1 Tax=Anopheles triannulatus TaxID=58253 RepID=A0A2M4AFD4_9DIPT
MMWLKLAVPCLLLSISPFCDGYSTLFPADLGLAEEDVPFMPRERDEFDDCHIHYARYARTEAESLDPFEPYPEPRENSHVAAIGVTRKPGNTIEWLCMGTLIWENVVLTTAHCTVLEEGNANPDVVRLGGGYYFPDSAITAADSEHVIERKVSAIVRHPEFDPITGANDIAVVKLDELVRVNPSVAPVCLWLYTEIPFSRMESVGRSRLQAVRNGSPKAEIINEVYFQRNKNKCASFGTGVCMERNRTIANECSTAARGDILQRRLVHNFATSPFLIGLLTSHSPGGQCPTLRSYAPVNQYRDWLIEAMQQLETLATRSSFHPVACALRYAHVRPRVEGLLYERIGDVPRFAAGVAGDESRYMTYIVQLAWPQGSANARNDCVATYVDQRTLLTLAECVLPTSPTSVRTKDRYRSESFEIADVVAHPKYSPGSSRNNIAVIKLKSRVEVVPACPWLLPTLPDRVDYTGIGRMNLQNFLGDTQDPSSESIPSFAMPAVTTQPWQLCGNFLANLAARNQSVPEFTEDEHLCFGDEQWQVPDGCSLLKGAPVMRYIVRSGGFVKYLFGLSLAGKFCGLGLPSVAVAIAPHADWLRSVILNPASSALQAGSTKGSSPLIFINPDLKRSDECTDGRGSLGICVPHEECTSTREQLGSGGRVTLCTNGSIICCAWGDIARGQPSQPVNPVQVELDSCEERYQAVREERFLGLQESEDDYGNLASVAEIGWVMSGGKISFPCSGFLITLRTIVTTARCAESNGRKPTVARIGSVGAGQRTNYLLPPIRKVTVHDDYDETNGLHNIALITLSELIVATPFVFPSCLWKNQTHLPAGALLLSLWDNEPRITTHSVHPMYYSECRERLEDSELLDGQICMLRAAPETKFIVSTPCFTTGSIIMWENTTANPEIIDAQHLVALHSHGDCRENDDVLLTIRVSDYYDWIVSNIK